MDFIEYNNERNRIDNEAWHLKRILNREYALSHNNVKIGDIVTDHLGSVQIESIRIYHHEPPSCIYRGTCYTKTGKPCKLGKKRDLYQININEPKK